MAADTQFVHSGFQDNLFGLAGQYFQFRTAEKQAEASGNAQRSNFATPDVSANPSAEPVPVVEQQRQSGSVMTPALLIGGGLAAVVVLALVLKK